MAKIEYSLQIKMIDMGDVDEHKFYQTLYPMVASHVELNFPGRGDSAEIKLRKEPRHGSGWLVVTAILKDEEVEDGEKQRFLGRGAEDLRGQASADAVRGD